MTDITYTMEHKDVRNDMIEYHTQAEEDATLRSLHATTKRESLLCEREAMVHREMVGFWNKVVVK